MKNEAAPSLYFSAYPLKEITKDLAEKQESEQSPFLKAMLNAKTRTVSRVRVFPMVYPYRKTDAAKLIKTNQHSPCFGLTEKAWFKNYE